MGYIFYCHNHSTGIVEPINAKFVENGKNSVSKKLIRVNLDKVRVDIPTILSHRAVVILRNSQQIEENEQHTRNDCPLHEYSY